MPLDILVVDDSAVARAFVKKTLKATQLEIGNLFQAEHGEAGLAVLESNAVDVILTDINMPVMDGVAFVDELKQRGLLESKAVIVVSTEKNEERIGALRALGVRAFLCKPFGPTDLRDLIDELALGRSD